MCKPYIAILRCYIGHKWGWWSMGFVREVFKFSSCQHHHLTRGTFKESFLTLGVWSIKTWSSTGKISGIKSKHIQKSKDISPREMWLLIKLAPRRKGIWFYSCKATALKKKVTPFPTCTIRWDWFPLIAFSLLCFVHRAIRLIMEIN